jgi:hypothetical protein
MRQSEKEFVDHDAHYIDSSSCDSNGEDIKGDNVIMIIYKV